MSKQSLDPELKASASLATAYAACREIARTEAKNFYYAFLALPSAKRDAMCAVYAFMRHADDLADDESMPHELRRERLQAWLDAWRAVAEGGPSNDLVLIALADTRVRYSIPFELLEKLVEGTAMDLTSARGRRPASEQDPLEFDTYATFEELYRYCYLVASVVGLVCIRIFGFTGALAEQLAEELGVAFQLTNILRDVREDAERGRIYLPLDDLQTHKVPIALLAGAPRAAKHGMVAPEVRRLLAFEASRAERFYTSGRLLLPMIEPDSRPALWVLMSIYHRLLQRIVRANYDVFSARIGVPAYEKTAILAVGVLGVIRARLLGR